MSEQNEKSLGQIAYEVDQASNSLRFGWPALPAEIKEDYNKMVAAVEQEVLRRNGIRKKLPGEWAWRLFHAAAGGEEPDYYSYTTDHGKRAWAAVERELTKRDDKTDTH